MKLPLPFCTNPAQGITEAIWMVYSLPVVGNLRTDHAAGVIIVSCASNLADGVIIQALHFEGAGAWAVMGAGGRKKRRIHFCGPRK